MALVPALFLSISATTRAMRPEEVDGREYHFLSKEVFTRWIRRGLFLEWAEYAGNLYGTPKKAVRENLEAGRDVILEIELKGAKKVLAKCPEALMVFIIPPSLEELERRLRSRGTDSEAAIQRRLARAKEEIPEVEKILGEGRPLHYGIVNESVEQASDQLAGIIERIREEDEQTDRR
jgi:guanylate kinase